MPPKNPSFRLKSLRICPCTWTLSLFCSTTTSSTKIFLSSPFLPALMKKEREREEGSGRRGDRGPLAKEDGEEKQVGGMQHDREEKEKHAARNRARGR